MTYKNRQELFDKMNWEGGLEMFLDYGLSVDDLPFDDDELYGAVNDMLWYWDEYQERARRFMLLFEDCEGETW